MIADERKTALSTSVGADDEQLLQSSGTSITAEVGNCNGFYEKQSNGLSILPGGCLKTVTMNELLDSVFTGKPPIIEGLLYRDTYLFTGAPKVGKSFFMAQLAYHVSTGKALWGYSVRQGKVLYLALEDNYERLQKRLYRMFGEEGTDDLYLAASSGTLGDVLDKQLIKFLTDNPDTCLVIIDTLKRIRETDDSSCSYNEDYDTIMKLKGFADRRGICLMLVHHNRKLRSEDIFEMNTQTKAGMPYSERIVNEDVRRLFALGMFADVVSEAKDLPNGNKEIVFKISAKKNVSEAYLKLARLTLPKE